MSNAEQDVINERARQLAVEGYNVEHDDRINNSCELAAAAACYSVCGEWNHVLNFKLMDNFVWPWAESEYKPKDYRSNLVRAAALLIAEIERIDRKTMLTKS